MIVLFCSLSDGLKVVYIFKVCYDLIAPRECREDEAEMSFSKEAKHGGYPGRQPTLIVYILMFMKMQPIQPSIQKTPPTNHAQAP